MLELLLDEEDCPICGGTGLSDEDEQDFNVCGSCNGTGKVKILNDYSTNSYSI